MTNRSTPTHKEFATTDKPFQAACQRVKPPATKRQASKYRRKKGLAWKEGRA